MSSGGIGQEFLSQNISPTQVSVLQRTFLLKFTSKLLIKGEDSVKVEIF